MCVCVCVCVGAGGHSDFPSSSIILLSTDKLGKTSLCPVGWKPLTPTDACWCQAVSMYTRVSRCQIVAWRRRMTSTRAPRQRWLEAPPWSVSYICSTVWDYLSCRMRSSGRPLGGPRVSLRQVMSPNWKNPSSPSAPDQNPHKIKQLSRRTGNSVQLKFYSV